MGSNLFKTVSIQDMNYKPEINGIHGACCFDIHRWIMEVDFLIKRKTIKRNFPPTIKLSQTNLRIEYEFYDSRTEKEGTPM